MVIELIAARILAPHIGVSLYTWTSIIGVILAGIALGNFLGDRIADKYPSPLLLTALFFVGGLLTVAIFPATRIVTGDKWFGNLPVMWNFVLKVSFIFFVPAVILSQDARLFLIQRNAGIRYDIIIGDVFNDCSTPYHLTTLEFDKLVKERTAFTWSILSTDMERVDICHLLSIHSDKRSNMFIFLAIW